MILLLLFLGILCLWKISVGYHDDFLSKANAAPIKGIFTVLILYSHLQGYILPSYVWYNSYYSIVLNYLGQLIVAMFFFYSGYGIWESFENKPRYQKLFFSNRVLKTLLHFDIAVLFFILVQLLIPITYSTKEYLLCWIGWDSVGNSNWFIFVILCLYLIALAAMYFHSKFNKGGIIFTVFFTALLWICLRLVAHKLSWWVDTMAAFPLGMVLSANKERLFVLLRQKRNHYLLTALCSILCLLAYIFVGGVDLYGGVTCLFCLAVIFWSSWIRIGNPVLNWLGKNAFTIYIIQRLPMIMLSELGLNSIVWLFVLLVIPATFLFAEGLSRINAWIDANLFSNA